MLQYILECIAFQLVFLIIYDLFLKRETFFQWNRVYLIGTYILSVLLPWIKIEAFKAAVPQRYFVYPEYLWGTNDAVIAVSGNNTSAISWEYVVFFGGMLFVTLLLGYKILQLYKLRKNGEIYFFENFTKIIISDSDLAFSFFKSIFMGDKILKEEQEDIIQHELVHIRQLHSFDLLFFELMRIVGWFNPLVYVYQGRISELHEFIADAHVAKSNKKGQYQLLLSKVFQTQKISFISQFFKTSLIRKRIIMLQKTKSKKVWRLKYLLLVPVVVAMLFYSSCQNELDAGDGNTIIVDDIENLTLEEERKVFEKLINLSENSEDWELYVKDRNSTMKFVPSEGDSFITGPNNERIAARLAIDSKLKSNDKLNIQDFLSKNSSSSNMASKYQELVAERNRLLRSMDENNPIIKNLDEQMNFLKKGALSNNDGVIPFLWTDEPPIFPGCENEKNTRECFQKSIQRHISKNFKYPQEAQEKGIQGRVAIMFTITADGNITDIRKRGPDKLLTEEAERIIKRLPKMKPGRYGGKAVDVPFSIPITFKLQ